MADRDRNNERPGDLSPEQRTLNRRTLIKGAAAAGAAAWAAPIIIESMVSPAAATTTCFNARDQDVLVGPSCVAVGGNSCIDSSQAGACSCSSAGTATNCSRITFTTGATTTTITVSGGCTLSCVGAFYGDTGCVCETQCAGQTTCSVPNTDAQGHGISHIDVIYCCTS